jgi:predicted protein tyrosine phosphatase
MVVMLVKKLLSGVTIIFSMGKENKPKLDKFHYHEMLDRLSVVMDITDRHLQQHPVAKIDTEIKDHISKAVDELYEAYLKMGNKVT